MNAGLLPLINQGWLWRPSGRYERWPRIGPMMPGEHPVGMLAESLARTFKTEMADIRPRMEADDRGLSDWLRSRKEDDAAFLLAIDQFEELFTFADPEERRRFDGLLASALEDAACPLFVVSTVRADFLDRFAEDLPQLVAVRNRLARRWTLAPIGAEGLRELIDGPARLGGLDVSDVKEHMVDQARDEPGALPLVENALHWLWQQRESNRLSGRLFNEQGGLAGILSHNADALLDGLGKRQRDQALELLFRLVKVDPEGSRHARQRMTLAEAVAVAGGGEAARALVNRLAGERAVDTGKAAGPLRLITITDEGRWVNLIHETLIRGKGLDAAGKPQPYWPTLWRYIEQNKERAARRERLQLLARQWQDRKGLARLYGLAGWSSLFGFRGLAAPGGTEQRYLLWSRVKILILAMVLALIIGVVGENIYWAAVREVPLETVMERWAYKLGKKVTPPDLVKIPEGSFKMGSEEGYSDEQPPHLVTFTQPFYLGRTEVTFREWDACVADSACNRYRPGDQGWGRETLPVINVSWHDAQAYVAWLSGKIGRACRLPSEAEWEYAARAGTMTEYALPTPGGTDDIEAKGLGNCIRCGSWTGRQTVPVNDNRLPANAWGLHHMHGNVNEWVEDCWHESYEGAPRDGQPWLEDNGGNCQGRVLRGGSWGRNFEEARSAYRGWNSSQTRIPLIGFRVVCLSPIFGN